MSPGHVGLEGDEKAVKLARKAASTPALLLGLNLILGNIFFKGKIKMSWKKKDYHNSYRRKQGLCQAEELLRNFDHRSY